MTRWQSVAAPIVAGVAAVVIMSGVRLVNRVADSAQPFPWDFFERRIRVSGEEAYSHYLLRDGMAPLEFNGWVITDQPDYLLSDPELHVTIDPEMLRMSLYVTEGRNVVASITSLSRREARVVDDVDELIDFLGLGYVAQALYANAGIATAEGVE